MASKPKDNILPQHTDSIGDIPDLPPPPNPSLDLKLSTVDCKSSYIHGSDDVFKLSPWAAMTLLTVGIEDLMTIANDTPPPPPPSSPLLFSMRDMAVEKEQIRSNIQKNLARARQEAETATVPQTSPPRPLIMSQKSGVSGSILQPKDGVRQQQKQNPTTLPTVRALSIRLIIGENSQPLNVHHNAMTHIFYSEKPLFISICGYLDRIHRLCPMSTAVYLATSLYIHRLAHNERIIPVTRQNAHRLVLAGLSVAMKALEDLSYPHSMMAKIGGVSDLELARLEISFCFLIDFELVVQEDTLKKHLAVLKQKQPSKLERSGLSTFLSKRKPWDLPPLPTPTPQVFPALRPQRAWMVRPKPNTSKVSNLSSPSSNQAISSAISVHSTDSPMDKPPTALNQANSLPLPLRRREGKSQTKEAADNHHLKSPVVSVESSPVIRRIEPPRTQLPSLLLPTTSIYQRLHQPALEGEALAEAGRLSRSPVTYVKSQTEINLHTLQKQQTNTPPLLPDQRPGATDDLRTIFPPNDAQIKANSAKSSACANDCLIYRDLSGPDDITAQDPSFHYTVHSAWQISTLIQDSCKRGIESIAGSQLSWWPFAEPERELQVGYTRIYSMPSPTRLLGVRTFYDDVPTCSAERMFPKLAKTGSSSVASRWKMTSHISAHESVACTVELGENDKTTFHNLHKAFLSLPSSRWKRATGLRFHRFQSFHFKQLLKRRHIVVHDDKERYPREADPEYRKYDYCPRPWEDGKDLPCSSGEAWYFYNNPDECCNSTQLNQSLPKRLEDTGQSRLTGWGIHVQQRYSILVIFVPVMIVTGITLIATLWFIPYWLETHQDDLQNATVPVMLALTTVQFILQFLVSLVVFRWSI
ncbi:cyclin-dependent protein kinase complex component [Colletotrichum tofieldiae]|uniref:Cyclin-dependent protein kinase complex component n=1 Tax=Colletotrichum tofieldiae TaxID=708197 RepID=A0A166YZK8_9PEZI|nr:cyclin-dependent protein kinase complex component [Colletotrichum tofieldiae]